MKKRLLFGTLILGLVIGGGVWGGLRLLKPAADCPVVAAGSDVPAEEIDRFVQTWQAFQTEGVEFGTYSLQAGGVAHYPLRLRWLLAKHCFTPERFFEADEKIRSALHALYLREHCASVIAILRAELETEKDEQRRIAYENMIESQAKIAEAIPVTEAQLEAVTLKMPEIRAVLEAQNNRQALRK